MQVTAGSSMHSYVHVYFQRAQLKLSKWSLKYSQQLLCRCDNICCFKTWVQPFLLLFFQPGTRFSTEVCMPEHYSQNPQRFQLRNAATTHQHLCLDYFHILLVDESSTFLKDLAEEARQPDSQRKLLSSHDCKTGKIKRNVLLFRQIFKQLIFT